MNTRSARRERDVKLTGVLSVAATYSKVPYPLLCKAPHKLKRRLLNGLFRGSDPQSDTVVRQTYFEVTVGWYAVSERNPARIMLIRHKTLSDGELKVRLLL